MSNIIYVRLDLDRFDLATLSELIVENILSVDEAIEAKVFKGLSSYQQLMQARIWHASLRHSDSDPNTPHKEDNR